MKYFLPRSASFSAARFPIRSALSSVTPKGANPPRPIMAEYRVELDSYAGPLDLLLFLVKRHEIDLYDIPIAELTNQYLAYVERMQQIDVERAGEFLVMAATLLEIKSRMLVPRHDEKFGTGEDDHDENDRPEDTEEALAALDPRHELVQQLLAYKRFKDAARWLEQRREQWDKRLPLVPTRISRRGAEQAEDAQPIEIDLEDIGLNDLVKAYTTLLESIGQRNIQHEVLDDDTPIALHQADLTDRLQSEGNLTLTRVFEGRKKIERIGLFIATLELVRQHQVKVFQDEQGDICLEMRPEQERELTEAEAAADWRDPDTGEMQYDWPNEKAKQRAERRAALRAKRAANRGQLDEEDQSDHEEDDDEIDLESDSDEG